MKDLDYLIKKANKYDLVAERLNYNTIKVYSPKYLFDSWLIIEEDSEFELWHRSKRNTTQKCSYHIQTTVPKRLKTRLLERIDKHNRYVAFYKHRNKVNLVDRVLERYNKSMEV